MPIPRTRSELLSQVSTSYEKLRNELDAAGDEVADLHCVDEWTVKDLLAVRLWWTLHVIDWVEAGKRGETPDTPAPGYRWNETPRLNAEIVNKERTRSYRSLREALENGYLRVLQAIESLDDIELLDVGVFDWAGNFPISRWISINTTRQYVTARTFIRRAIRENR